MSPKARVGTNFEMRQGVTIGSSRAGGEVPTIGDNVSVGAYAQLLGDIRIGDGATVGAMAVVLKDVPPGATVVGNPARIL